ncbi:MAG: D-alanyl-D-alanine carboxypeptidase [Rhodospirillales bacterium]|nr:D-alanyl-D-alanine carboxypeptidase [Rhodospirillales bacterium]MDH3791926.1 D-alanyl-D-alanine carboxypeptidase [Rhodospirillales bacterium]MDH3914075.1 D-alanyl-D-alanine carboxypeptidase [Rhodospirillales bacterium]MDH3918849.1 D-alanyl-D-alanine carboxypeptidase [Rhodospirillales bacterium]MDH3967085.1 D-alanyl-D-alanine carboxypeptidase [Rhodospirillales bacterium]
MTLKKAAKIGRRAGLLALVCLVAAMATIPGPARARYASIVIDAGTGDVLHEVNANTRNYPASLTKMMTLYLAFEALQSGRLEAKQALNVSWRAARMPASRLGLKRGQTISVENAILALVTKSANDAAVVLAEALAGSEGGFARRMTKKAAALGMTRTRFRNASGLHDRRQLSTARDMAMLARALIVDFPQFYRYFSAKSFRYKGRTYRNHNKLLKSYSGTDGLKTGYTRASGYNLATSTVRNGRRLIAVVFGGKTARARDRHMASLLDKGFAMPVVIRGIASKVPASKPANLATTTAQASVPSPPPAKPAAPLAEGDAPPGPPESKPKQTQVTARAPISLLPPGMHHVPTPAKTAGVRTERAPKNNGRRVTEAARQLARTGSWGVQVGAFYSLSPARKAAHDAAERLPGILGDTQVVIPLVQGVQGPLYRARLMGLSKTKARTACRRLKSLEIDCLVVQSKDGVKLALNDQPAN